MTDIPERLRERALDTINATGVLVPQTVLDAVATALYEIEQAARAEGERTGAEAMRETAVAAIIRFGSRSPGNDTLAATIIGAVLPSTAQTIADLVRALPAPAVPAKEA